jgi:hypothetical protein
MSSQSCWRPAGPASTSTCRRCIAISAARSPMSRLGPIMGSRAVPMETADALRHSMPCLMNGALVELASPWVA